ncbi:hypothetical protein [Brevibacillus laterosporus]|uniref:hypothetical protein n=1 Tax=Brevibacillus laterosporus TaxID=1465 RepID=UPI0003B1D544|nr:hypothetical protein [Brevibacillus laterosporus]ERM18281.1 hypothetical protein P615_18205 [Brevibacillus laterosporus PE36]
MYTVVRGLKKKFSKNATVLSMKKWAKDESGFKVFEKFGLTQGGVLLALGVCAVAVIVMNEFWSQLEINEGGLDTLNPDSAQAVAPGWGKEAAGGWK